MAKTKQQLIVENNTQFPDNNTGFIQPDNLRTFNRDMIESMVDELAYGAYTASIALQSASFDNRIDALEGLSSSLSASVTAISSSVLGLSASVLQLNDYTSSANNRLDALEIFTGSLNGFTASVEAQFAIYDEEIYNLNVHSQSLNAVSASVNLFTSSANNRLNSLESATSSYAISASVAAVDAAQQAQINALIAFTGSAESTGSLFASASFTNDTITFTRGDGTTQTLGGFANTGSNVFVGNQIISGNLDISGTVSASLEEGYLYVGDASGRMLAVATSSIITQVNTGSLVNTASFNDFSSSVDTKFTGVQTSTASLNSFTSSADTKFSNIEASTSSLNAFTSSAAGRLTNIEATTASLNTSVTNLNTFTQSADSRLNSLESKSGSYATTGSNNFIGNQFISGGLSVTGSSPILLRSGSLSGSVISNITDTFNDVPSALYIVTLDSASYASVVTSSTTDQNTLYFVSGGFSYVLESDFANYSSSVATKFNNVQASTASLNSFTSSAAGRLTNLESTTASLNTSVSNINSFTASSAGRLTNIEATTASLNTSVSNINSFTASAAGRLTNLEATTASLNISVTNLNSFTSSANTKFNNIQASTSSLNTFTQSADVRLTNLEASTSSLGTSLASLNSFTSSQIVLNSGFLTTSSFIAYSGSVDTRLNDVETVTVALIVSTTSLNAFTASAAGRLNNIEATTASLNTSVSALNTFTQSQTNLNGTFATTGSNAFNGNQIITGSLTASLQEGYAWVGNSVGITAAIPTSSFGGGGSTDTGSLLVTASAAGATITFTKGNASTFDVTVSAAVPDTGSLVTTASFNSYTSSTDGRLTNIEATTASLNTSVSNLNTFTSSANTRLNNLEATTASLNTSVGALNTFTASQTNLNGTFATTGSNVFRGAETISGSVDISGSFKINSLNYPTASGVADYFLQTNGTNQADWNYVRTMYEEVKNGGLTTLPKGTPVFASSSVGNLSIVIAADAGDPTRMPATYVLNETLAADAEGLGIIIGFINGVDTSAFNEGDVIYVGVGGGYTNVPPTGSALIQPLGIVNRVDASNGSGIVLNPGVANGLPNIAEGNAWVGNADGVPTAVATSSFGGGGSTDISALNSFTASQEALNTTFATTGSNTFEGEQTINGTFTASLQEGYAWVGDSTGTTVAVATSSFGSGTSIDTGSFATTGSNTFVGDQTISGSIAFGVENFYVSGANSGSFISNITDTYTSSTPIKYVTTLDSASYAALATGSTFSPDTLYVVSGALDIPPIGNTTISGSITITGSAYGNVNTLTVTSATASMDMRAANFFVLTLPTGSTTHLDATNVGFGQTVSLLVKQASTATGSLVFSPEFKFPTGSRYTASPTGSAEDIITFVTFNSTGSVYATSVKQMI
jgi:hypothetical protein